MDYISEFIIQLLSKKLNIWFHLQLNSYIFSHATSVPLNTSHQGSPRCYEGNSPIKILHQSHNFLAVDKPYDVLINSDDSSNKDTVEHYVREIFPSMAKLQLRHGFHFVHRLDYSTSGLILLALNKKAASIASEAFSSRKTKKYYIALVRGHVSQELMDLQIPIGADSRRNHLHRMCSGNLSYCAHPKPSQTRLLVLQKGYYIPDGYPVTKVLLRPITGRRHQLRVHCNFLGHTIVGDYTYSNRTDSKPRRMFLHSYRLILPSRLEDLDISASFDFENANTEFSPCLTINELSLQTFQKIDSQFPDVAVTS